MRKLRILLIALFISGCVDSGLCSPAHGHTRRPGHALFNLRHYSEQSTGKHFRSREDRCQT